MAPQHAPRYVALVPALAAVLVPAEVRAREAAVPNLSPNAREHLVQPHVFLQHVVPVCAPTHAQDTKTITEATYTIEFRRC